MLLGVLLEDASDGAGAFLLDRRLGAVWAVERCWREIIAIRSLCWCNLTPSHGGVGAPIC